MTKPAVAIILCGGFGESLLRQLLNAEAGSQFGKLTETIKGFKNSAVHGAVGSERVIPALIPLHGRKAAEWTVRALEGCRRLAPVTSHTFFVVNELDYARFHNNQEGRASLLAEMADMGWSPDCLISNGVKKPEDWQGDGGDLRLALAKLGTDFGHALILSGELSFLPGYNMQRILEHAVIRNKDCLGYSELSDNDVRVMGYEGHTSARLGDACQVPPIVGVEPASAAEIGPGSAVAEPVLVLKGSTLALAAASKAHNLFGLANELRAKVPLCGVDLGYGRFRLTSALALDHADRCIHFWLHTVRPDRAAAIVDEENEGEAEEVQRSLNRLYAAPMQDPAALAKFQSEFDGIYFGGARTALGLGSGKESGLEYFKLPNTFYMTQYRRQGADIMR